MLSRRAGGPLTLLRYTGEVSSDTPLTEVSKSWPYAFPNYPDRRPSGAHSIAAVHNNGGNLGFLDGHPKWLGFPTFMGNDNNARHLRGLLND